MAKAAATTWLTISGGLRTSFVYGPAELISRWPGSRHTGRITIYLIYWQPLMELVPSELVPQGASETPHLLAADAEEAKIIVGKLGAALAKRYPDLKTKRMDKGKMTIFTYGAKSCHVMLVPETHADVIVADRMVETDKEPATYEVEGEPVLVATVRLRYAGQRARATADEILFVDAEAEPESFETSTRGAGIVHGVWNFEGGIAVAQPTSCAQTDIKGMAEGMAGWEAALANKSAVALRLKDKELSGGAGVLRVTPGRYRGETGGDATTRWVRFTRET